ncbi:MAG: calcium/sodium antiporter [Desulfotomaculum sp.]|nr:calcium/sodium antiporter [Desulfotomaculum sp.]
MIPILIWSLVFAVSLFVLLQAADYFIEYAEKIGSSLGVPIFIIGATIVAFGTSLPELVAGIFAVLDGTTEIVVGNVVGSNITNIFLIFALAAIIAKKITTDRKAIHIDLFFMLGSAFYLALTIWDGVFTMAEGLFCLAMMVMYVVYTVTTVTDQDDDDAQEKKVKINWKHVAVLIISGVFIYIGAKYTVDAIVQLAGMFNIGAEIIALSAVALGTSLPELSVALAAIRKGIPELAIGNVLGSNIFNILAVMGIPALISPLVIPVGIMEFSLPLMLLATLMFYWTFHHKEVCRWQGILLLAFYVFFLGRLFEIV